MNKRCMVLLLSFIVAIAQFLVAQKEHAMDKNMKIKRAIAVVAPTKGNTVHGIVTFEEVAGGVHVVVNVSGLIPGNHGFHIHEFGDVSSDDGSAAGGHFNPMGMPHNMPMSKTRHMGDMGNIVSDSSGNAHLDYIDPVMNLDGEYSIIGHAVIIHQKEDDFKTQPTGNAGPRVGQGVIGIAKQ